MSRSRARGWFIWKNSLSGLEIVLDLAALAWTDLPLRAVQLRSKPALGYPDQNVIPPLNQQLAAVWRAEDHGAKVADMGNFFSVAAQDVSSRRDSKRTLALRVRKKELLEIGVGDMIREKLIVVVSDWSAPIGCVSALRKQQRDNDCDHSHRRNPQSSLR
jgi:hypothetical protein